ncbi:hypothetical protein BKA82DRAFT_248502 [Pisolithus tinctorius]|uniref:Uncharacterized protein n=1 Tax=Pisolithus tinctorius Marx 270 TaxID=870435 RepID=A0A0C3JF64_PISTI|nr:hypothetical protein BKA82DRAFT_248502 [Pisolithus tinctorius]KIN96241.1 hypothetical protein M404DRAFT_248502 [Pisolithus tinctorius Marx 270]
MACIPALITPTVQVISKYLLSLPLNNSLYSYTCIAYINTILYLPGFVLLTDHSGSMYTVLPSCSVVEPSNCRSNNYR